ncbi:MAG: GNAT family N-acetyltransferase [Gammaproteobacteria bacterium]
MAVVVAKPSVAHERAFVAMVDFDAHDAQNAGFYAHAKRDFERYVQTLLDEEHGVNLREGYVPCTHRWLMEDTPAVIGVARLRHNIGTPFLANEAGHIGYDVAPSWRGRGYGHRVLQAALVEARALGIERVLLFADENNEPSRKTIVRQGGQLESIASSEHWQQRTCRYWIEVSPHGS